MSAPRFEAARQWLTALPGVTFRDVITQRLDPSDAGQPDAASVDAALPLEEAEPSGPCRHCEGTMYLTDRTERPRVIEILWMPWERFAQARPGPIVTLGERVAEAQEGSVPHTVASAPEVTKAETSRDGSPRPASAFL